MKSPLGTLLAARNAAPIPYIGRGNSERVPWYQPRGTEAQMRAMGNVGTLFAIVDRLATSTTQSGWGLYRTPKSGRTEDRVEVTSHLALDMWRQPNEFFTRALFIETFQQHFDLVGEAWWVVARHPRARSIPLELWPVRPDRMTPIPSARDYLAGYVYTSPDGEQIPLARDEVIPLRRPNPIDPYRGIGPVQTILADLEGVRLSAEWNRNFFLNSAEPGGLIQFDRRLSDDEFDEVVARWQEQHQGVANAHRVAIIEGGEWVDRKYTNRDMQFTELRGVSREVIREAYGIPKFAVGDVEDVNRATAQASKTWFAEQMTVPRLERIKQALNAQFLPLFGPTGRGVEFDYDSPVPEDREADNEELTARANAAAALVMAGWDGADVLTTVGLPPMQYVGAAAAASPEPPPLAPAASGRLTLGTPRPSLPRAEGRERLPEEDLPDITPLQESWTAALDELLAAWGNILAAWIDALVDRVRALVRAGDRAGLATLEVPADDVDNGAELLAAAMVRLAHEAAAQAAAEAAAQGVDITPGSPDEDELTEAAAIVARMLARELAISAGREGMRLSTPAGDGDGDEEADRVADGVRAHLDDLTDARPRQHLGSALTQAQNTGRAATFSEAEQGRAAPSVAYYANEKNDSNTCALCREVDRRWLGNSIAAAAAEYPSGGYVRCLGRERCRGAVVAVYRPEQTDGS